MIETTIMAHHLQIQNIIHLQTSQNPILKHEMKNINTKRDKKNLHNNTQKLQQKNIICFGMSNYQKRFKNTHFEIIFQTLNNSNSIHT
jgi:hypothetical protein